MRDPSLSRFEYPLKCCEALSSFASYFVCVGLPFYSEHFPLLSPSLICLADSVILFFFRPLSLYYFDNLSLRGTSCGFSFFLKSTSCNLESEGR